MIDNRSAATIDVRCKGGVLDGMVCRNGHYETVCDFYRGPTGSENPTTIPTGEIEFVQAGDLENAADISEMPEMAEDPTGGDTVVIENQSGTSIHDAAMFQLALCRLAGGVERAYEEGTVGSGLISIGITCTGGLLDGMACRNSATMSQCLVRSVVPEDPRVTPVVAQDPTGGETVVIYNQSGDFVDRATGQVLACRAAGGTETVNEERTHASGLKWVDVFCKGGLLDGMWCANGSGYTICFFRAVTPEDPRVTPAAGVEIPAENAPTATTVATEAAPSPTATSTATPPMPTMTPTDVPAEPTVAPTTAPPPPPRNDDSAPPPGEAEDPKPTPTEVILF